MDMSKRSLCISMINRRNVVTGGSALALAFALPCKSAEAEPVQELFAATRKSPQGAFSTAIFRRDGSDVNAVSLPGRGHDVTACPVTRTVVAFARRPGNFAVAFSIDQKRQPIRFICPSDRHFYGHGVFSRYGRLLYATENDFETGTGCIGIYDATRDYKRIGEFNAFGVGPHDIALMPDGETLVIAVGGIETHPDIGHGRTKLNIATMSPALVYINTKSGDLLEKHELPRKQHKLSLRHLAVGTSRTVIVGGQLQRGAPARMPLVLRHQLGKQPELIELPNQLTASLRGYISSVAVNRTGDTVAITGARGGVAAFFDIASGRVQGTVRQNDVSGVTPAGDHFLLTSGDGAVVENNQNQPTQWVWDNHAEKVG
ncbi:MAG: DUF1513 domain-containing protein [Pseudomonadota bacterium]